MTGSNQIEKDRVRLLPGLIWGKVGERVVWFSVWGRVDVFFTHGMVLVLWGVGVNYSREWLWNLKTKLCCIASGKWNVNRVSLQKLDINYVMF